MILIIEKPRIESIINFALCLNNDWMIICHVGEGQLSWQSRLKILNLEKRLKRAPPQRLLLFREQI